MAKKTSLFIDINGDVEAIHTDFVDGLNMGEKIVDRVSDVEFDNDKQEWYAEIRPDFLVEGATSIRITGPTRQIVLDKEHEYVTNFLRDKHEQKFAREDRQVSGGEKETI